MSARLTIATFKVRCFVCFKAFVKTERSPNHIRQYIYIDSKTQELRFFDDSAQNNISSAVSDFINSDTTLLSENDNTRGNTYKSLIGLLADGNFELFFYSKCPRCKCSFHSPTLTSPKNMEIQALTFEKKSNLSLAEQFEHLKTSVPLLP